MDLTRRSVLLGAGGLLPLGYTRSGRNALATVAPDAEAVGVAVDVGDDRSLDGFSDEVTIETVPDPFRNWGGGNGDGGGKGDGRSSEEGEDYGIDDDGGDRRGNVSRNRVLHVTSLDDGPGRGNGGRKDDENDDDVEPTFDIALSLVDVSEQELTVSDLADFESDAEDVPDSGLYYEWAATEADVVGADTDRQGLGSPDDVWLFLDDESAATGSRSDRSGSFFENATAVFRTLYADRNDVGPSANWSYEEWVERPVTEEFEADGWKTLSLEGRSLDRLEDDLLSTYGDVPVVGVGVSRGDPFYGPSVLDAYYRNLHVNGERYRLPATIDLGPGRRPR